MSSPTYLRCDTAAALWIRLAGFTEPRLLLLELRDVAWQPSLCCLPGFGSGSLDLALAASRAVMNRLAPMGHLRRMALTAV